MQRNIAAAIIGTAMLFATAANADNDGITRLTTGGTPAIPGITLDIGTGAVDRTELSASVQGELDGIATTNAAQAATLAAHGTELTDHGGRIGILEASSASHAAPLADHETRITAGEAKDAAQDARRDTAEATNAEQDARHDAGEAKDVEQDGRHAAGEAHDAAQDTTLATHGAQIVTHSEQIGSLDTVTAEHGARLDAHDALLSSQAATLGAHGKKLAEHERGLAIAMAMPDAWLSDKKRFGIFGAVGGFGDETALGFAAVGRIDETWTLNAKGGTSTDFKGFGWQIGAGAQF